MSNVIFKLFEFVIFFGKVYILFNIKLIFQILFFPFSFANVNFSLDKGKILQ